MNKSLPKINPNVLVTRAENQLLVYVERAGSAHCLSGAAVEIFLACRDQTSEEELTARLEVEEGDEADKLLFRTLSSFEKHSLIEPLDERTRREFLTKGATIAATLPVFLTVGLSAPTAAMSSCLAASQCNGTNFGAPCIESGQTLCTDGRCIQSYLKQSTAMDCMGDIPFFFNCISASDPAYAVSCNTARNSVGNGGTYHCESC